MVPCLINLCNSVMFVTMATYLYDKVRFRGHSNNRLFLLVGVVGNSVGQVSSVGCKLQKADVTCYVQSSVNSFNITYYIMMAFTIRTQSCM